MGKYLPDILSYDFLRRPSSGAFHPIHGASGSVVGGACHAVNTSLVTQLRNENEASSEKYRALVQNGSDLIFVLNASLSVTYVSPSLKRTLDFTPGSSLKELETLVHEDDLALFKEHIQRVNDSKSMRISAFRIQSLSGQYIWLEAIVDNLLDNPHISGSVFNARDISKFKNREQERESLINELTKSNADLMQFSFITSHNLTAPLSNIKGLLSYLYRERFGDEDREVLSLIDEATKNLADTITDLSRILVIKNNLNIARTSIDIEKCFHEVNRTFLDAQNEINAELTLDFKAPYICFNQTYLESIFVNLISNAIKYRHPDRKLKIHVSSRKVPEGVKLEIRDNGLGMNLDRQGNRLFGMYQRFHSNIDGQGLGLFIVKAQVKALGGTITARSREGYGTTFIILIPHAIDYLQ